ncbi:B3 domain-containing protein Os01g0905400-like isoform X8 [Malus sylvestris]|uniref:B3 domain-containing protein Os01g0905400-like isoform X8 n=1 Tax=Malus sylvestris TaxID=3752 RepID=UPI0021AC31E7|nr:B3 domain-containing protein Os01g0905400-like isoform X8 [Malus sylvestris]
MGSKLEACAECTLKCLQDHANKKKASPVVASFFKIMIGDQLSKVLFLPPKFAPNVSALVNKKAVLEDSRGRQWKVTISRVDGSLAFQQGWNAFALDNDLQVGQFLNFNYVTDSHFNVKIYDKSGCEKLKFPEAMNQKKWTWDNQNSSVKDGPCHKVDNSLMDKQGSSTSLTSDTDEDIGQDLDPMNAKRKAPVVTGNASNCDNSHERSKFKLKEPDGDIGQDLYGMNAKTKAPVVTENASNCDNSHKRSRLKLKEPDGDIDQHLYDMNDKGECTIVTENASNYDDSNEMPKLKPKEEYIEDMICMINRELGNKQEDNRSCIYDSLNFELLELKSGTGGRNEVVIWDETCSHHDDSSVRLRKEAVAAAFPMDETYSPHDDSSLRMRKEAGSVDKSPVAKEAVTAAIPMDETCSCHDDSSLRLRGEASLVDKAPVAREAVTIAIPSDAYTFDGTEKNNSSEARVKKVSPSGDDSRTTNKTSHHLFPTAAVNPNDTGNKVAASKKEHDLIDETFQRAKKNFTGTPPESFDMMTKAVKKESVDLISDPCFQKIIPEIDGKSFEPVDAVCSQISNMIKREKDIAFPVPVVKSEPVDQVETFPSSSFSCLVAVGSQSFLELPVRLPIRMTIRGRHTPDRRVIFLQDTTMRLWPVLYIDNCFSKILSSGWEAFSKANNIQPGDTCAIGIEDASERICSVHIIRT